MSSGRAGRRAGPRALDSGNRLARRGGASTSEGHPYTIVRRALERGNPMGAEATAKELPRLGLADALELTILIARVSASARNAERRPIKRRADRRSDDSLRNDEEKRLIRVAVRDRSNVGVGAS